MNNYLDLALLANDLPQGLASTESRRAGEPRLSAPVSASLPADIKAAFTHAPIERSQDITGRWRPNWSEESAEVTA